MINVKFFTTLRLLLKIKELDIELEGPTPLQDVLTRIEDLVFVKTSTRFLEKLVDPSSGVLNRGTIILLNGRNVLHLQKLATLDKDNDALVLFPPGGGG